MTSVKKLAGKKDDISLLVDDMKTLENDWLDHIDELTRNKQFKAAANSQQLLTKALKDKKKILKLRDSRFSWHTKND
mgnify:CR=1 FL=1